MKLPLVLALVGLIGLCGGCVSKTQRITVKSNPTGAEVRASTGVRGVTPFEFQAYRREHGAVTIHKKGYQPISVMIVSRDSRLQPNPVLVQLSPMISPLPSRELPPDFPWLENSAPSVPVPIQKATPLSPPPIRGKVDANGTEYL